MNLGRVWRFGAAVLVHMLYTIQFCAKQNLSKSCTRLVLLSAQDIFAQLIQPAVFFVALTDGFHSLTGLPFTSVLFTEIPLIAKGHIRSV